MRFSFSHSDSYSFILSFPSFSTSLTFPSHSLTLHLSLHLTNLSLSSTHTAGMRIRQQEIVWNVVNRVHSVMVRYCQTSNHKGDPQLLNYIEYYIYILQPAVVSHFFSVDRKAWTFCRKRWWGQMRLRRMWVGKWPLWLIKSRKDSRLSQHPLYSHFLSLSLKKHTRDFQWSTLIHT